MSKELEFVKFWSVERAKGIKSFYKKNIINTVFITLIAFCIKVIVTMIIHGFEINMIIEDIKIAIYIIIIFPTTTWIYNELNYKRLLNKH